MPSPSDPGARRLPVVAIVGRPNVGKSTLVNRILRRRAAVVEAKPGVTRDRREFNAEWTGTHFIVVDTGGWEVSDEGLAPDLRAQAEAAVSAADAVLFVADATTPLLDDDLAVARILHQSGTPALLVANKADSGRVDGDLGHLWALGLGEPHPVSALHGRNIGDLLDELVAHLPESDMEPDDAQLPGLVILGRPNVGKSTLLNRLVGERRVIVSDVPGTTRDPIDVVVDFAGRRMRIVDTAGIRRTPKIAESTEFYSVTRAREVLDEAEVAILVLDGTEGATQQEQRLAEEIATAGAGLVVVLNKWDVTDTYQKEATTASVGDRLAFVSWAPVLRMAALTGARVHRLEEAVTAVLEARQLRIPTHELNRKIITWQEAHPAPTRKGRRTNIMYAVQAGVSPPTIVLFTRGGDLAPEYLRFLEGRLRKDYEFFGTPIRLVTRRRTRRDFVAR